MLDMEVLLHHNGYSHVLPPWETKMIATMSVLYKHMLMDQEPSVSSHVTERGHVKRSYGWDCAELSYCSEARAGEYGLQWSVGSRLIGFEKHKNSLGEIQSCACWVICGSVPVCVAVDRLSPCM